VLVGIIVGVQQGRSDNARGGGRHKRLDKGLRLLCQALLEEITLLSCLAEIGIVHRGERLWGIIDFRRLAAPGT
jgi:hypothetical protein